MKTTIKNIEEKTFGGKVTGHVITLENGVTGYLDDKNSSTVTIGDAVDYTLAVKKNKKGGDYNLLTLTLVGALPPAPDEKVVDPNKSAGVQKALVLPRAQVDIIKMKIDSRMLLCELTHKFILEGKLSDEQAQFHITTWVNLMDNLIDGAFV
jgi:hypothetical protein